VWSCPAIADSEMPQGVPRPTASCRCAATALRVTWCSTLPTGSSSTSDGIRYSNIEPDQDFSPTSVPQAKNGRPSAAQCATGTSPLAMASRLVSRDSLASRS